MNSSLSNPGSTSLRPSLSGPARFQGPVAALGLAALWLFMAWRGYPFPGLDDGAFMGVAVNIAEGHGLVNTLLEGRGPFFAYPPLYPYLFGGWLWLFGKDPLSVVICFGLMSWAATWCTVRAFQIRGQQLAGWLTAAALVFYFSCMGLRADVPSIFFLSLSLYNGISTPFFLRVLAVFWALVSVAILPASLAIAAPWLLYLLGREKRLWLPSIAAVLFLALTFCLLLHGRVFEFWESLSSNARRSNGAQMDWLTDHRLEFQGLVKFAYPTLLAIVLVPLAIWRRGMRPIDGFFALTMALGLAVSIHSVSGSRVLAVIAVAGGTYYFQVIGLGSPWKSVLAVISALLITGAEARPVLQGITTEKPSKAAAEAAYRAVENLHPAFLIIDSWSFRYVFHYHIRPDMLFIGERSRPASGAPFHQRKFPDECWVIAADTVQSRHLDEPGLPVPRQLKIGSHPVGNWVMNAGELGVLPPTHDP